jgi:hypothetical protein
LPVNGSALFVAVFLACAVEGHRDRPTEDVVVVLVRLHSSATTGGVALAVVAALALTYGVSTTGLPAWPVLPATVAVLLP